MRRSYLQAYGHTTRGSWPGPSFWMCCETTGITATAGIGTNLYLGKIAMDIVAKHIPADEYGRADCGAGRRPSYRRTDCGIIGP